MLTRAYGGVEHQVTVLDDGFEYCGERYASLSKIARESSGRSWNGFLYFGMQRRTRKRSGRQGCTPVDMACTHERPRGVPERWKARSTRCAPPSRGGASVASWSSGDVNVSGTGAPGPRLAALLRATVANQIDVIAARGLDSLCRSPHALAGIVASIRRASASVLVPEVHR